MAHKLVTPTVHLNGTGKETLLHEYVNAMNAVEAAIVALQEVTCHGRDYYPQGKEAMVMSMEQKQRQWLKLKEVHDELETIAVAISEQ